jgi:hypothetical protein
VKASKKRSASKPFVIHKETMLVRGGAVCINGKFKQYYELGEHWKCRLNSKDKVQKATKEKP